jgi:uncharacterized membrane protein YecN with MAPEG domain
VASVASVGFGVWHFFVPGAWKWYSYMDPAATELVAAVRATNVFFSLSLVLFGLVNLVFVLSGRANAFAVVVMLVATSVLWVTRVVFQLVYPQGSMSPALQYGMLAAFILIALCYLASVWFVLADRSAP